MNSLNHKLEKVLLMPSNEGFARCIPVSSHILGEQKKHNTEPWYFYYIQHNREGFGVLLTECLLVSLRLQSSRRKKMQFLVWGHFTNIPK